MNAASVVPDGLILRGNGTCREQSARLYIYCDSHRPLLERFYASEVGVLLRETPGTRVVEVYADAGIPHSHLDGNRVMLHANESYGS